MRPKNVYCALSAAKFSPPAARLSGLRRRLRRAEKRGFAVVLDNHDRGSSRRIFGTCTFGDRDAHVVVGRRRRRICSGRAHCQGL
jgi:hypothetical protein